ncbi:MAG: hypothetical protein AAF967_14145 [Pseudomonadota bacterium]
MSQTTLDNYLDDVQCDASRVNGMIEGIALLHNEGTREAMNAACAITEVALKMTSELVNKLDSTVRPSPESQ